MDNADLVIETPDVDTTETSSSNTTPLIILAVTGAVVAGGVLLGKKLGWFGKKDPTDENAETETPAN